VKLPVEIGDVDQHALRRGPSRQWRDHGISSPR
jgi:hypothetical protein